MIGLPYGSKMTSRGDKGFVYLLRPNPELWTIALPHRTQILYAPDMSFITAKLNLSPGAKVVEAGTGSGSFTHVLARTVSRGPLHARSPSQTTAGWKGLLDAPSGDTSGAGDAAADLPDACADKKAPGAYDGRVWSFEFHAERVRRARLEFEAHGLDRSVVLEHRNVCRDGFGVEHVADAVFLDLPAPWEAIPFAREALKDHVSTRICCFSPCIEQVLRTVTALSQNGFTDVTTYETLVRTHESITNVAPLESISGVVQRIRSIEHKREKRREMQIAHSRMEREKRKADGGADEATAEHDGTSGAAKRKAEEPEEPQAAKRRADGAGGIGVDEQAGATDMAEAAEGPEDGAPSEPATEEASDPAPEPPAEMLASAGFRQKAERRRLDPANVYSRPYPQVCALSAPILLTYRCVATQATSRLPLCCLVRMPS